MLDELTHAIAAWLAELAETCEPSTIGARLRDMRRFCRWLVSEGELEKAPTDGIELPNSPNKPVPILLDAEITALLKACAVPRGRPGVFDRTVFGTDAQQQRTREDRHQLERHRSHGSSS